MSKKPSARVVDERIDAPPIPNGSISPSTSCGIHVDVDRPRLNVVVGDAARAKVARQLFDQPDERDLAHGVTTLNAAAWKRKHAPTLPCEACSGYRKRSIAI
jgi:hypothetical protein